MFDSSDERERLERLLSHPESAEALSAAMTAALTRQQQQPEPESKPEPSPLSIGINRHFMINGGLLVSVLMLAAAVTIPLRDTYSVCFNPNQIPGTSKCLGVKTYTLDQDHVEQLVSHPGLVIVPKGKGNPVLAVGLALFGTAIASGSGFIAKQSLREKSEQLPLTRTNRRALWTAHKLETDKVIRQQFDTNKHAVSASDTTSEFEQLQILIAQMPLEQREMFFQHLALKAQEAEAREQLQAQAQQPQNPLASLLGVLPQQQLPGTPPNELEAAKETGKAIINSMAASIKSKVLVAPSRAGKTTTLYLYYDAMFDRYPGGEVFVIGDKREKIHPKISIDNYAFCDGESFGDEGLEMLNTVYEIYQTRAKMPESERDAIAAKHPIRLALIDWLATWTTVRKDEKLANEVNSKLIGIITKGAGCGVAVDIDTHSATVETLGIDSATRESLDFMAIAYSKRSDNAADGLGLLPKVVSKPLIVASKGDRDRLAAEFNKLRDALLRGEFNSSIIFTTTGGNRIGITPHFERKSLGDLSIDEVEDEQPAAEDAGDINNHVQEAATIIRDYLATRGGMEATFKHIRDQRSIRRLWHSPTVLTRLAIQSLLEEGILELVSEVIGAEIPEDKQLYRLINSEE